MIINNIEVSKEDINKVIKMFKNKFYNNLFENYWVECPTEGCNKCLLSNEYSSVFKNSNILYKIGYSSCYLRAEWLIDKYKYERLKEILND